MTSIIADNLEAKKYDELQKSIDFDTASDKEQLDCMLKMQKLLSGCKGTTPIFDWGTYSMETGQRIITSASEQLDSVNRRVKRFQSQIKQAEAA